MSSDVNEIEKFDLPPKFVPVLRMVLPTGTGLVGLRLMPELVGCNPVSCLGD